MDTWEEPLNTTFGGPHLDTYERMRTDFESKLKSLEQQDRNLYREVSRWARPTYDAGTGKCTLCMEEDKMHPQVAAEVRNAYRNIFEGE